MVDLSELSFFIARPQPCGYLTEKESTTIFVDPEANLDKTLYSQLSNLGFRRSGNHIYRPECESCRECISIRIPTARFSPSRSQMRCLKRNSDLSFDLIDSIQTDEYYQLYEKYINERHNDGDMYPATREQYDGFLTKMSDVTQYLIIRNSHNKLISVAVVDVLLNGLSAIYTFFDPDEDKRSLGVFSILSQIQWAQQHQLPYVFLGYLIDACQKMNYKRNYKPYQLLLNNQWLDFYD